MEVAGEKLEILITEKFIIEKGSFIESMAATRLRINLPLKKGVTSSACFRETQYPWK